jgi:hypothetical protein
VGERVNLCQIAETRVNWTMGPICLGGLLLFGRRLSRVCLSGFCSVGAGTLDPSEKRLGLEYGYYEVP